ncbi:hypothetical protein C8Q73DRAFT_677224 [Cubamyces lactineus]|nr:hypothetical protein C8Q73DRAFT_677020 [Cubamyces lactineus]KAH9901257.1 hypothetical protein C8Q73DRAFT_677224 [Cubamyces lactineus]
MWERERKHIPGHCAQDAVLTNSSCGVHAYMHLPVVVRMHICAYLVVYVHICAYLSLYACMCTLTSSYMHVPSTWLGTAEDTMGGRAGDGWRTAKPEVEGKEVDVEMERERVANEFVSRDTPVK